MTDNDIASVPEAAVNFDVLLMMDALDNGNMQRNFAVNKHLHTVASRWNLLIYNNTVINYADEMEAQRYTEHVQIPYLPIPSSFRIYSFKLF